MSELKTQIVRTVRADCMAQALALPLAVCGGQQMDGSVPQFPPCKWSMMITLTSLAGMRSALSTWKVPGPEWRLSDGQLV